MDEEMESHDHGESDELRDGSIAHPSRPSVTELEEIRRGIDAVASSDKLDKDSALQVTGLFHSMESLMRYECNLRDRMLVEMKSALELATVKGELARMAQQTAQDYEHPPAQPPFRKKTSRWG